MCPTRHFVYIFFNQVFQVSTAKNEINLFNNHVLIVAPVTFAPAGAMTPSAEFLSNLFLEMLWDHIRLSSVMQVDNISTIWTTIKTSFCQSRVFLQKLIKGTYVSIDPLF